uniref:Reverse transcriptase domain-containing protein n=1 Tax=Tanacetum cinerariifolium TaxID=118510 RepID=A0A6L2JT03_TANCI|nr:reverse transcriptase domain-containing protein [Tanacetum cinerariifolium]
MTYSKRSRTELRTIVKVVPMADNRTIEELLQAPTEGYGEAIVIPEINVDHFEIKTNFLQLVQANTYHGFERENPHTHINNFKRITSTLKFRDVPNDMIKLMMFLYSLEGSARVWYDKEPPNSILTLKDPFTKLSQIDTFYNGLNDNDQDSLNAAAGGNLLSKTIKEVLQIIENKSKVRYSRNKPNVSRMNTNSRENASKTDDRIDKLADQISTLFDILLRKFSLPLLLKRLTTGTYNQVARQNRASNFMAPPGFALNQVSTSGTLPSNTIPNPKGEMKAITTRSGVAYEGPSIPTNHSPKKVVERETEETTNKEQTNFQRTKIPLNENCLAMLLKRLPKKLGDPDKFLIPCDFSGMDVCHALADLGASINLMPLSILKMLSLPKLTPTQMTLELTDRSITLPKGVTEDVFVKVGKFYFPTNFLVVDFEADPLVPLILGRSFLRIGRALIDVYGEEITLQVNDEVATFNLNQTTTYSSTYDDLLVNRIDVIDVAREELAQEMLGFSNNSLGGNPTSTSEPILFDSSPSFTPFKGSDFILEEIKAYLKDESISSEINHADCDPEGDICLIENLLNNDSFQLPLTDI